MTDVTPLPGEPTRISVAHFVRLFEGGVLGEDDRVELLEGG